MLKKLKKRLENVNLDPKKELRNYLSVNFLFIAGITILAIFTSNYLYFLIIPLSILILSIMFLSKYNLLEEDKRRRLEIEFVEGFSYIRIYLVNKENVYSSIKKASQYTSKEMNEELNKLLIRIDEDKTIVPFLDFGHYFKNKVIDEVMIALYQMVDGGYSENFINQFINVFDEFKARSNNEALFKRYSKMGTINQMSLVGSGYLMFVMLLVIINIIGDLTNGF